VRRSTSITRAPRDDVACGRTRALQTNAQCLKLGARIFVGDSLGERLIDSLEHIDGVIEIEQNRVFDSRRVELHDLGKAAFGEQKADAVEIADHIRKGEAASPEWRKLWPRHGRRRAERLGKLLVADELDARGKRLV
jgi:hypothetical protein